MPTTTIDLTTLDDPRDGVHRVVQALAEGAAVKLPLSDGLRTCRLATTDAEATPDASVAGSTEPTSMLFASVDHAADFLPPLTASQARLLLRSEPDSIVFRVTHDSDGPLNELPAWVREAVTDDHGLAIRVIGNPISQAVMSLLPGPLVTGPTASLGEPALELLDGSDAGDRPSVVQFAADQTVLVSESAVTQDDVSKLIGVQIVLICTGNTCRSPMAEVALKGLLAKELNTPIDQLGAAGINILSAGLAARGMSPASPEAVATAAKRDLDLSEHRSRPASLELIQHADAVFTMTQGHRASIVSQVPQLGELVQTLVPDGRDVDDPIGAPASVYDACYNQIEAALKTRLPELLTLIDELRQASSES